MQTARNKKGKANPSDSNKWKMVSFNVPIPKNSHQDVKHCILFKKHGGIHLTHNTDFCRYEKDGTHKRGVGKGQHNITAPDKKTASAYAQHSMKIVMLEKFSKKLKKSSKKCKCEYESDSDDSDSS